MMKLPMVWPKLTERNRKAIQAAARIARSPRPNTPSPIAFILPKPGQPIHPVHAAWDARDAYRLARECFLAFVPGEKIYTVVSLVVPTEPELSEIIRRAGNDTAEVRHLAMSVRRGRRYLQWPIREAALKILADRYPNAVTINALCAELRFTNAKTLWNFLGRNTEWFRRTSRGCYALAHVNIQEAVYQRQLDAQRAREINEFMENYVRDAAFTGEYDVQFQRYINSRTLATSGVRRAYDAGLLEEMVWEQEFPGYRREPEVDPVSDDPDEFAALIEGFDPGPSQRTKLEQSQQSERNLRELLQSEERPGQAPSFFDFLPTITRPGKAKEVYAAYQDWCQQTGAIVLSQARFGAMMREVGFEVKRNSSGMLYTPPKPGTGRAA